MSSRNANLYGLPRPQKSSKSKDITSANTLAFSSALSSLISTTPKSSIPGVTNAPHDRPSPRPRSTKGDIFVASNRNTNKRVAADMLAYEADAQKRGATAGKPVDEDAWRRAKRKMEEKARLYAAMKRGDVEDADDRHMVDFDRKWAEREEAGKESEDESEDDDDVEEELVDYVDEFGRSRRGTKAEAAREERRRNVAATGMAPEPDDRFTARPSAPSNIILGDTIQAAAFRPDDATAEAMADLAARRDREMTPPEEVHYDANWEIRTKGTGFFQFAKDADERKQQMENLEKEREETERVRREREAKAADGTGVAVETKVDSAKEKRKKEVEERRRLIAGKRGKVKADKFLDELEGQLLSTGGDAQPVREEGDEHSSK